MKPAKKAPGAVWFGRTETTGSGGGGCSCPPQPIAIRARLRPKGALPRHRQAGDVTSPPSAIAITTIRIAVQSMSTSTTTYLAPQLQVHICCLSKRSINILKKCQGRVKQFIACLPRNTKKASGTLKAWLRYGPHPGSSQPTLLSLFKTTSETQSADKYCLHDLYSSVVSERYPYNNAGYHIISYHPGHLLALC